MCLIQTWIPKTREQVGIQKGRRARGMHITDLVQLLVFESINDLATGFPRHYRSILVRRRLPNTIPPQVAY